MKAFLDRSDLSADMKAILYDIAKITIRVGEVVVALGRRIVQIAMTLIDKFPHTTLGLIVAVVIATVISTLVAGTSAPWLLGLAAALQKLVYLLGIGAGVIEDLRQNAMKDAMDRVTEQFQPLNSAIVS